MGALCVSAIASFSGAAVGSLVWPFLRGWLFQRALARMARFSRAADAMMPAAEGANPEPGCKS